CLWYSKDSGFELTGFSDADNAGCKDTFRAQFLGEKLLTDYGFHFHSIPVYCVLKSAIAISCNLVQHSRTKHIAVRYHFIKEHVEKGTIELYFVKTDYQLAELFTKALPADRFNYLVRRLVMNENPSRVIIKQFCGRISRWCYNLIPAESRFKTSCSIIKDTFEMKAQFFISYVSSSFSCVYVMEMITLSFKTDYQLADLFTKALPADRFNYLVHRLGMRSLSPQELDRLAKSQ
nr:hypothetical protein [Tanacetum cinerariifolium]